MAHKLLSLEQATSTSCTGAEVVRSDPHRPEDFPRHLAGVHAGLRGKGTSSALTLCYHKANV